VKISNLRMVILLMLFSAAGSAPGHMSANATDSSVTNSKISSSETTTQSSSTPTSTSTSTASTATSSAPSTAPAGEKPSPAGDDDEVKVPKNFIHTSTLVSNSNCKIKCLDPHAATEESAQVIDILQKIYIAYADKDLDYISKHLAPECITFYEGDKKVISGKQAALDDIKEWTDKESKNVDTPLQEIILDHPYCNIDKDVAVITFVAIKEVGGKHPSKSKSHCNDVFKKDGDTWLLLTHYRSSWKEI
jgi:uncharacterized protein YchJ